MRVDVLPHEGKGGRVVCALSKWVNGRAEKGEREGGRVGRGREGGREEVWE